MSRSVSRFVDVSGLRKVAQGFEWIATSATTVLRTLTQIVPLMGAITGAASIAGMVKLVSTYAAWSHQLVQNADDIGITTQQLQQFQDATRLAGGDAGDMTSSLQALHTNLANLNIGQGNFAEVTQALNYLGVNARDANGHLRNTADLMPEVIAKIAALKDPADRARFAAALLGGEGAKLVETFRQSHQSFADWFTDASRYTELTDEQKRSLQLFTEAQGRAATAFDHLGQQISVVLARDFAPLLNRLSEFVEKHTPDIVAAIDRISQKFVAWLQGVDWSKVEAGINKLLDGLKWVINNLDTVKVIAEAIAVVFAIKWAVGIAANIATVANALGAAGTGTAGGSGLLGSLGRVLALANATTLAFNAMQKAYDPKTYAPENLAPNSPFWRGIPEDEQRKYPNSPLRQGEKPAGPSFTESPSGWLSNRLGGIPLGPVGSLLDRAVKGPPEIRQQGSLNLPQENVQRGAAITARLASDLQLTGPQASGITGNLQAESGLQAVQERNPIGGGRGGFGWAQWTGPRRDEFEAYAKANNLDPKSDEANYGFLVHELQGPANARLLEQLRNLKGPDTARQAAALVEQQYERPAVSNAGVRGQYADRFAASLPVPPVPPPAPPVATAQAAAPPVTVPPPAPPNGAVDVSITHKNAPPNSSVTATGTGSVNVAPVRVEHQDMANI